MWAPVYVQHWSCVATYCRVGFVNSTSLVQREDKERSSPTCLYDYGNKSGIDSTKGTIPGHTRNPDVIIALVIFHRLPKYMPKLALSYHSPHCVSESPSSLGRQSSGFVPPLPTPSQSQPSAPLARLSLYPSRPHPHYSSSSPAPPCLTPNRDLQGPELASHPKPGNPQARRPPSPLPTQGPARLGPT